MRWLLLLAAVLGFLAPHLALADTTGVLSGQVVNFNTQRPIANVIVEATSPSSDRKAHTDAHGDFVFLDLAPDTYRLSFTHALYFSNASGPIAIHPGEHQYLMAALKQRLWQIDGFFIRPPGLFRPTDTLDEYHLEASTVWVTRIGDSMSSVLRFVPGIEIGPSIRMMH